MFIRSKHMISLIKYTLCVLILACLAFNQGVAEDLDNDTTKTNLAGSENINLRNAGSEITLTLVNTEDTAYSGILSTLYDRYEETLLNTSAKVTITTSNQNSSTLTLNPSNGYANFAGTVIVDAADSSHAEGVLNLATPNIFSPLVVDSRGSSFTPFVTNNGTIIVNANQVLPNLSGSGKIQINDNNALTLTNGVSSEYSGDISGTGQIIITKPTWNTEAQITLSKEGGYTDFTGSVTIQAAGTTSEDSHAEGVLLTTANIFCNASNIANDGTLIVSANQVLPNLRGSGKIQINSNVKKLTLNNTGNTDYSGNITGIPGEDGIPAVWSGEIIKTGSGKIALSHDSGYVYFTGNVTVQEGALELPGAEMFRDLPNTSVITNNGTIIAGGGRQMLPNLKGSGNLVTTEYVIPVTGDTPEIVVKTSVTSYYAQDAEISGIISGPGNFVKKGPATLTLSGANTISGEIKISEGKIRFMGDAIVATCEIDGASNGHIEYYVTDGTKVLYIPEDLEHIEVKTITKTGGDTLQIYEGSKGSVRAESFVISSGRIDYGGYFQSVVANLGSFDVKTGTTLSPGLSVDEHGEPVNTIGEMVITNGVTMTIESAAIALFEFDAYNENPSLQKFDKIVTQDVASVFAPDSNSIVDLAFLDNDAWKWAKKDAEYHIVFDYNFPNDDYTYLLREQYRSYFSLLGKNGNGLYLVGKGAPEPPVLAVPEPSSWALLIGGLLTFLLFLKKKQG